VTDTDILEYYGERLGVAINCGELDEHKAILQAYSELRKVYTGPVPESIKADIKKAKGLK